LFGLNSCSARCLVQNAHRTDFKWAFSCLWRCQAPGGIILTQTMAIFNWTMETCKNSKWHIAKHNNFSSCKIIHHNKSIHFNLWKYANVMLVSKCIIYNVISMVENVMKQLQCFLCYGLKFRKRFYGCSVYSLNK